jgi:alcohol dehydrogenase
MGSMTTPLPLNYADVLRNNWAIIGNFMYSPAEFRRLVALVRMGALDLGAVDVKTFPLAELPSAMEHAAKMRGLDCTVVTM